MIEQVFDYLIHKPDSHVQSRLKKYLANDDQIAVLQKLVEKGEQRLEILCKEAGCTQRGVFRRWEEITTDVDFDDLEPYGSRPDIDALIMLGLNLREIGDECGCSKQAIFEYLKVHAYHKTWKSYRRAGTAKKIRKEGGQLIVDILNRYLTEHADENALAVRTYLYSYKQKPTYPVQMVEEICSLYPQRLRDIGKKVGMHQNTVRMILTRAGKL